MARSRGRRSDYNWQGQTGRATVDNALATVSDSGNTVIDVGEASTLVRIHGDMLFQLDASAVDERIIVAWGLIKVAANQVSVGVTSMPHPFTDIEDDWIAHGYVNLSSGADAAIQPDAAFQRVTVDSKAMRKFKATESLAVVVEVGNSLDQGGSFDWGYGFRVLFAV